MHNIIPIEQTEIIALTSCLLQKPWDVMAALLLLGGLREYRLGPDGLLLELEHPDGVIPQNETALLFGQSGIIQNLKPQFV
jgi:hypothetical protein